MNPTKWGGNASSPTINIEAVRESQEKKKFKKLIKLSRLNRRLLTKAGELAFGRAALKSNAP